jgi:hypothetical protein
MEGDSSAEVPVWKSKTEIVQGLSRAYEVVSQLQCCRSNRRQPESRERSSSIAGVCRIPPLFATPLSCAPSQRGAQRTPVRGVSETANALKPSHFLLTRGWNHFPETSVSQRLWG